MKKRKSVNGQGGFSFYKNNKIFFFLIIKFNKISSIKIYFIKISLHILSGDILEHSHWIM
jgi:hypothetical protein